ncbi:hypothetical protein A9Q99_05890 [Gammaproteobacteria bacterium 45_16_T64]|nr:hypothetical protein A9Q99_05890 [Gammaproteobacteria bacterium 45_16_T64]
MNHSFSVGQRITQYRSAISIALVALLLTGCKNVVIEEPQQDSVHPDTPAEFRIAFSDTADISNLSVQLNGEEVSALFDIVDGIAYATDDDLQAFTVSGQNILAVENPTGALPTRFIIDREGPTVFVTSVVEDSTLQMTGYVEDDIGTQSLVVNGQSVTVDEDNGFSVTLPPLNQDTAFNVVTFTATDNYERESTTRYAHPTHSKESAMLPNTLGASITDYGINYIIDTIVEPLVRSLDLTSGLRNTTLASTNGSVGYARVVLNNVTHGTPSISLDTLERSGNGAMRAAVSLPFITISVTASAGIHTIITPDIPGIDMPWPIPDIPGINIPDIPGIDINIPASPRLSNVRYETTANLSLVDNALNINLADSSLILGGLDLSAFSPLNSIFNQVNFSLETVLEDFIEDAIQNELPGLIPDIIDPLWVDTASEGETSGKLFGTDVEVSTLVTQRTSFDFGLDTNIVPLSLDGVPDVLGSLYQPAALPVLDGTTPSGESYHAAIVLSETLLNQTLLAAYYNGLTHITVSATGIELGAIDGIDELPLSSDDSILLTIIPLEPSTVGFNEIDGAMLDLSLRHMEVTVSTQSGDTITPLLSAIATLNAPLDLFFNEGKNVSTRINGIPEVELRDVALGESVSLSDGLTQALVDYLIVKAVPSLTAGFDIIPLPEFSGYRIGSPSVWTTQGDPAFLVVAGDLEEVPNP